MKKIAFITLILAVVVTTAFTLATIWKVVDADKVVVNFALKKEGTKGTFTGIDASIDFDEANPSKSSIKATIKVKSLKTDSAKRDGHLQTAEFFDAEKYPTITFVSNEIVKSEKGFTAKGKLTMKGKTLDEQVWFSFDEKGSDAKLNGVMEVSPYEFGVMKDSKSKDEVVKISVTIPLKK
ncbi:MAG: YceI family protein [Crocinitomicaceae bacterium]|nr:YceI family protein [Crocinitomicaceae bacterium]